MTQPTVNELKIMIDNLDEKLDSHAQVHEEIKELIKQVIVKVDYTNGKVGDLVRWRERVLGMTTIITLVVLPLLGWALWQIVSIDEKIDDALANYEVKIVP